MNIVMREKMSYNIYIILYDYSDLRINSTMEFEDSCDVMSLSFFEVVTKSNPNDLNVKYKFITRNYFFSNQQLFSLH